MNMHSPAATSKSVESICPTSTWHQLLTATKQQAYFKTIISQIKQQRSQGITIYPPQSQLFAAFKLATLQKLKVVILGQDPDHGPKQAHGLAFSVQQPTRPPPSLMNIFRELQQDLGITPPAHGDLSPWARQGVLLLNTCLSVIAHKPGSHSKLGWQIFTDYVIEQINLQCEHVVFMLWGAHAHKKQALIDSSKHSILTTSHPSPLSAHRGFKGCKHFSRCNRLLLKHGQPSINWQL